MFKFFKNSKLEKKKNARTFSRWNGILANTDKTDFNTDDTEILFIVARERVNTIFIHRLKDLNDWLC